MPKIYFATLFVLLLLAGCDEADDPTPSAGTIDPAPKSFKNVQELQDASGNTYAYGYDQASSNNQNPVLEKYDRDGKLLFRNVYETSGVDGRLVLLSLDSKGRPYAVFSVDGGNNSAEGITKRRVKAGAFEAAIFRGYGRGGGAKVAVIARLDENTGLIEKGTFFLSRTSEGNIDGSDKTNSMAVQTLSFAGNAVQLDVHSWYLPPAAGASHGNYTFHPHATDDRKDGGKWVLRYLLSEDLTSIISGEIQ